MVPSEIQGDQVRDEVVIVGNSRPRLSRYLEQGGIAEHLQCYMSVGVDK